MRASVRAGTNLIGEPSAVLVVREVFEAAGGFDVDCAYMIDFEAWMRVLDRGELSYVPRPLCTFRVSHNSWSAHLARQQAGIRRVEVLRALRAQHPAIVTRGDLAIGLCKPTLLSLARRVVFAASTRLPSAAARPRSRSTPPTDRRCDGASAASGPAFRPPGLDQRQTLVRVHDVRDDRERP